MIVPRTWRHVYHLPSISARKASRIRSPTRATSPHGASSDSMCNRTAAWRGTFRSRTCICFDTRTKMNAAVQRSHGVATRLIGSSSRCAKQSSWLLRASARHVQRACSSMHVRHRLWLTTYCKTISCACIGICLNCFWPAKVSGPASQCIAMSAVSRTSLSTASLLWGQFKK